MARTSHVDTLLFQECPESYYMLGVIYSDGSLNKSKTGSGYVLTLNFSKKDEQWLKAIKNVFFPSSNIRDVIYKKNNKEYLGVRLSIQNTKLNEWLLKRGIKNNKTKSVKMPKIPDQYLPDFIRGYIDGDGHVSQNKKNGYLKISIASGSDDMIDDISKIYESKNIKHSIWEKNNLTPSKGSLVQTPKATCKYIATSSNQSIELAKWIYYDGFPEKICLKRKYRHAKNAIKTYEGKIKNKIVNEDVKEKARELRGKGYSLGMIADKIGIKVQNFAPYVRDIKPDKLITKKRGEKKRDYGMPYDSTVSPTSYLKEELKNKEVEIELVKKSHPLFAKWYFEHYPNSKGIWGRSINFIIYRYGEPIGCIGFCTIPKNFQLAKRFFDGIDDNSLLNNNIFKIVKSEDKNIGTKALRKAREYIKNVYKAKYGDELKGLITFVEPPRSGAVYKADNWKYIGNTEGKKRIAKGFKKESFIDTIPKHVFAFTYKKQ